METLKRIRLPRMKDFVTIGLTLFLLGLLCYASLHDLIVSAIRAGILQYAVLSSPSAGSYPGFMDSRDPSGPSVYSYFYLYNITNTEEILAGGKPKLDTIGPLVYLYHNTKHNVSWENYGDDLLYKEYQRNFPVDDATRALENVEIVTLDLVLLAALNNPALRDLMPAVKGDSSALFTRRTPHDMLWGYVDTSLLNNKFPGLQLNDTSLAEALLQHGHTRISTGAHRPQTAMEFQEWSSGNSLTCCEGGVKGEASVGTGADQNCAPAWASYEAATIKGIFGTAAHPDVSPSETINLATYPFGILRHWPMQCKPVASPSGAGWLNEGSALTANVGACDSYPVRGISLLKFSLPTWAMGNASESSEESQGYRVGGPSGVIGVGACEQHAPIFLSRPHFLYASNSLSDAVEGLSPPDPTIHDSWLGVEPLTGQILDFHFRLAFNVFVNPITVDFLGLPFTYFPDVATGYFPIGWGSQESSLSDSQANTFKGAVYKPVYAAAFARWGGAGLMSLGGLFLVLRMAWACWVFGRRRWGWGGGSSAGGESGEEEDTERGDAAEDSLLGVSGYSQVNSSGEEEWQRMSKKGGINS